MNIFCIDSDPVKAAQMLCDKHAGGKMVVESGQMLSTAHRMLDGMKHQRASKSGKRTVDYWIHPDKTLDKTLYKAVHYNHPCTVWTMQSSNNYIWHYIHFISLCNEYTYRYGKIHKTDEKLRDVLMGTPKNIPIGRMTKQPLAMKSNPECMFEDVVESYRAYYQTKQKRFDMVWSRRDVPDWFKPL